MGDSLTLGGQPNDLINLRDAARLAGEVHPTTVRRWIGKSMLKAYRRGPSRACSTSARPRLSA